MQMRAAQRSSRLETGSHLGHNLDVNTLETPVEEESPTGKYRRMVGT